MQVSDLNSHIIAESLDRGNRRVAFYFNLVFMHQISKTQNGTLDALILGFGCHTQYMTQQALNRRQFNDDICKRKCIDHPKLIKRDF